MLGLGEDVDRVDATLPERLFPWKTSIAALKLVERRTPTVLTPADVLRGGSLDFGGSGVVNLGEDMMNGIAGFHRR